MNTQIPVRKAKDVTPVDMNGDAWRSFWAPFVHANGDVWRSFREEMDRMFGRMSGRFPLGRFGGDFPAMDQFWPQGVRGALPAVDMTGDDKGYKVTAELPGIDTKDVEISLGNDFLAIKAEKHQEHEETSKNHFVSERSYGLFQRTFALPTDVERDKIGAKFEKGVLTVTLPKCAKAVTNTRKIEVKTA